MSTCEKEKYATYNPHEDIYPCLKKDCNSFHKSSNILKDAFEFLQIDRINAILSEMERDDVLAHRISRHIDKYNLIEYIFSTMYSRTHLKGYEGLCVAYTDFTTQYTHLLKPFQKKSIILIMQLIKYLSETYPELITKKNIDTSIYVCCFDIAKILLQNYIDTGLGEGCYICSSNVDIMLLDSPCVCKSKIHLPCLMELIKTHGNTCPTCKTQNAYVCPNGRICFPSIDVYKSPLVSHYTVATTLTQKMDLAIAYLCVDKVKKLLENITDDEFKKYCIENDYYAVLQKCEDGIKIRDVPYTNLTRVANKKSFSEIEKMLQARYKKVFSLVHIAKFDKVIS